MKSGPWGLAMILLLCVAVYFLMKSMSKHLRNVRDDFPSDAPVAPTATPASAEDSSAVTGDPVDPHGT